MSFEGTVNYNDFQRYKKIKNSLSFEYKGVELNKPISLALLGRILNNHTPALKDFCFLPFLLLDPHKFVKTFRSNDVVIATFFENRNDYTELVSEISNTVPGSVVVPINPHKKAFRLNIKFFLSMKKLVFDNPFLKDYSFKFRFYLFLHLIYLGNQIDNFEIAFRDENLKGKKYIPFNSAAGVEALLTLFFSNKGVETFHIFHGIFGRYKVKIPNDVINGENITAKSILSFGVVTKADLEKDFGLPPASIFVSGNPKYPKKEIYVKTTFKRCLVLNGFGFYDKSFALLLPILDSVSNESGIMFEIKPHPNSDILNSSQAKSCKHLTFLAKGKTVKELLEAGEYDFAITYNTVTYYECMYFNMISLRFALNENLDFEGLDDRFTDKETLLEKINDFRNSDNEKLNNDIEELLRNTLGMGINNYELLINNN